VQLPQLATPAVTLEKIWEVATWAAMPVVTPVETKLVQRQPSRGLFDIKQPAYVAGSFVSKLQNDSVPVTTKPGSSFFSPRI
tara:strand:+ start:23 stop:268 length:246 start_codon:yes stop_codon:yes gene_type:complete